MNISDRTPYTYLIGWSKHNKFYYGSRYAKNCHPSDLWKTYFTSSKYVKKFRENNGEPDIIQIRKTFDDPIKARLWEIKVISKLNIVRNKRFFNIRNPGGTYDFYRKGFIPWNKGKIGVQKNPYKGLKNRYTKDQLLLISNNTKIGMSKISFDTKKKIYAKRDNCNNRKWMNKEGTHIRVNVELIDKYVNDGWKVGRLNKRDNTGKFIKEIIH